MERSSRKDIQKRAVSEFGNQCNVGGENKTDSRQTKRFLTWDTWENVVPEQTESARGGAYLEGVDTVMNCL